MANKANGLGSAKKLKKRRKLARWKHRSFIRRALGLKARSDPLRGASQARGIVLAKVQIECKQPNSGLRKCISASELVLLSNNLWIPISEIENNFNKTNLHSFNLNKKKIEPTKLTDYIKEKSKLTYKIVTKETKRSLIATSDHPFYTKQGKKDLKELKEEDKVAVLPKEPAKYELYFDSILNEEDIRRASPKKSKVERTIKILKEKNLLPLNGDNPKLSIIVKLLGYILGDGNITLTEDKRQRGDIHFCGDYEDLDSIRKDMKTLGFKASSPRIISSRGFITDIKKKKQKVFGVSLLSSCYSMPLVVFFKALGAPIGKKTDIKFRVPNWILNSKKLWVKQLFLASYFGCEMTRPLLQKQGTSFRTPYFSLNRVEGTIKSGLEFVEDVRGMLNTFDIEMKKVVYVPHCIRKDKRISYKIKVYLSNKTKNLVNLYGKIGYEYNINKEAMARYAYEYLKIKKSELDKRLEAYRNAIELNRDGTSNLEIIRKLQSSYGKQILGSSIRDWANGRVNGELQCVGHNFIQFKDWLKMAIDNLGFSGLVWETVEKIEKVSCRDVRDITTLSNNHNFFANGFLTGNCVKVQLAKNSRKLTAFVPGNLASKFIDEHDEVVVECIGGKMGRAKGDLPGIRWQVIKVNDQSLKALVQGKIEKGRR